MISIDIRYEDLVQRPDEVQARIENMTDLVPLARFSEYPAFVRTPFLNSAHISISISKENQKH